VWLDPAGLASGFVGCERCGWKEVDYYSGSFMHYLGGNLERGISNVCRLKSAFWAPKSHYQASLRGEIVRSLDIVFVGFSSTDKKATHLILKLVEIDG
jgi:hypothetical protein